VSESRKIGGNVMDQALDRYLRSHYNIFVGEQICEEIKISVGSAVPLEEEETFAVKGRNMLNGIPTTVTVNSTEVREALRESIVQIIGAVRSALEQTPPELASDIVNTGINLTGGGSLLKRLDDALTQETNLKVHRAASPLTTIIEGLGMILSDFRRYRKLFNLYAT